MECHLVLAAEYQERSESQRSTGTTQWCAGMAEDQQRVKMKRNSCGGNEFPHPFCREKEEHAALLYSHFRYIDFKDNKVHSNHSVMLAFGTDRSATTATRNWIGEERKKAKYLIGKSSIVSFALQRLNSRGRLYARDASQRHANKRQLLTRTLHSFANMVNGAECTESTLQFEGTIKTNYGQLGDQAYI